MLDLVGCLNRDGKMPIDDFLSGMIKVLPPLHELARNAGLDLPAYLGELQREAERLQSANPNRAGVDGPASDQTSSSRPKPKE